MSNSHRLQAVPKDIVVEVKRAKSFEPERLTHKLTATIIEKNSKGKKFAETLGKLAVVLAERLCVTDGKLWSDK